MFSILLECILHLDLAGSHGRFVFEVAKFQIVLMDHVCLELRVHLLVALGFKNHAHVVYASTCLESVLEGSV